MNLTATITTANAGGEVDITVTGTWADGYLEFTGATIEGCPVDLSRPEQALALAALSEARERELRQERERKP